MSDAIGRIIDAWRRDEAARAVPPEDQSFYRTLSSANAPVLLLHGAGGRPGNFLALAEDLAAAGWPSVCPLLPGHGRPDGDLRAVRFGALAAHALLAFDAVAQAFRPPAIIGQSVGAVVALRVALERSVPRVAALAPAIRPNVARRVGRLVRLAVSQPRAAIDAWRWQSDVRRGIVTTIRLLPELRSPLLVLHSIDDDSVSVEGARELVRAAGSATKRLVLLQDQGHVLSIAPDRARVARELIEFLRE